MLSSHKPLGGGDLMACYMTSFHGKGVQVLVHLSVHPSVMLFTTIATSVGICNGMPSTVHSIFFMQLFLKILSRMAKSVDPDQTTPSRAV